MRIIETSWNPWVSVEVMCYNSADLKDDPGSFPWQVTDGAECCVMACWWS